MPQATHPKAPRPQPPLASLPTSPPMPLLDRLPAYAELHCRSNFSFLTGASHPEELVARAAQLGYAAIAITDECSVAGVVRAHEEAKRQAEAGSTIQAADRQRVRGAGRGEHARLSPGADRAPPRGLWRLVRADHAGAPALREGAVPADGARSRQRAAAFARRTRLPRAADPAPRRPARGLAGAGAMAAGHLRRARGDRRRAAAVCRRLAAGRAAGCRGRPHRPAAGGRGRCADAPALAQAGAGHADCRAFEDAAGRLRLCPRAQRRAAPALAAAAGAAVPPGVAAGQCAHRRELCVLARRTALRIPGRTGARGPDADRAPARAHRHRRARALPARLAGQRAGTDRKGNGADRSAALRSLLPHRARHRALCTLAEHPVPGPRLGGQFGGLLLPGHHRSQPDAHHAAVRALHLARAQRAARHRRRFRARAARGSHPVHLRQVRHRAHRAGRRAQHLPHARRGARHRQGARPRRAADRRAGALGALVRRCQPPRTRPGRGRHRCRVRRSPGAGWS